MRELIGATGFRDKPQQHRQEGVLPRRSCLQAISGLREHKLKTVATRRIRRIQWDRNGQKRGDLMICTGMSGNGARTGLAKFCLSPSQIRRDRLGERTTVVAAAVGMTARSAAARTPEWRKGISCTSSTLASASPFRLRIEVWRRQGSSETWWHEPPDQLGLAELRHAGARGAPVSSTSCSAPPKDLSE